MLFLLLHTPAQAGSVFFNHAPCSGKCPCDVPATLTLHPTHRAAQTRTSNATQTSKRRMHSAIRPALKTPSFISHSNAHAAPSRYLPSSSSSTPQERTAPPPAHPAPLARRFKTPGAAPPLLKPLSFLPDFKKQQRLYTAGFQPAGAAAMAPLRISSSSSSSSPRRRDQGLGGRQRLDRHRARADRRRRAAPRRLRAGA